MKKVEAIIRKSKFDEVKKALHQIEVNFFSYWDVTGVGNEKQGHVYRGISYSTSDIQRRYISIVVNDDFLERTILSPTVHNRSTTLEMTTKQKARMVAQTTRRHPCLSISIIFSIMFSINYMIHN